MAQIEPTPRKRGLPDELPTSVANFLAMLLVTGVFVLVAFLIGKGQIAFVLFSIVLLYCGRRMGWWLSKNSLYTWPLPVVLLQCVFWGSLVAYIVHLLILWHRPHWILQIIFGFALGAYVSRPNYGLLMEGTIPDHALPRHTLISGLPLLVFIGASIGLWFLR